MRRIARALIVTMTVALCGCGGVETPVTAVSAPAETPVTEILVAPQVETPRAAPYVQTERTPGAPKPQTPTPDPVRRARIIAVGDVMFMYHQIRAAKQGEGYDFFPAFEHIAPYIGTADIALANLETTIAGEEMGFSESGTLREDGSKSLSFFNAPAELLDALKRAGFNALTTANNHTLDKGAEGLRRTIENIRAAGLAQTGTFIGDEDRYLSLDANGISVAVLAYTLGTNKHTGGFSSSERAKAVNLLDKQRVLRDVAAAKDSGAEFVILCLHWGVEFSETPTPEQERLASEFIEAGVDVIAGSHPHVLQRISKLEAGGRTGIIAYSLGNFISNMASEEHTRGAVLTLDIELGETLAVRASYLPTLCARVGGQRSVLPAAPSAYAGLEGDAANALKALSATYEKSAAALGSEVAVVK